MPTPGRRPLAGGPGRVPVLTAVALLGAVFTVVLGALPLQGPPSAALAAAGLPSFRHIYWIWMENREYGAVIGDHAAPYINSLAQTYGLATDYYAIGHHSEMNYANGVAGQAGGVTDAPSLNVAFPNLWQQLDAAGISWRAYQQDYRGRCNTAASITGGADGPGLPGTYVARHDPAIIFRSVTSNPQDCARIVPLAGFDPGAQRFAFITPNLANDMHNGTTAQGDAFLRAFVPMIIDAPTFAGSALFITWDEGTTSTGSFGDNGGHVATLVIAPNLRTHLSALYYDHWGLLRTVEDAWGLGCLAGACRRSDLGEFFPSGGGGGGSTPPSAIPSHHPTSRPSPTPTSPVPTGPTPTSPVPTGPTPTSLPTATPVAPATRTAVPAAGLQGGVSTAGPSMTPVSQTAQARTPNGTLAAVAAVALILLALAIWRFLPHVRPKQ